MSQSHKISDKLIIPVTLNVESSDQQHQLKTCWFQMSSSELLTQGVRPSYLFQQAQQVILLHAEVWELHNTEIVSGKK